MSEKPDLEKILGAILSSFTDNAKRKQVESYLRTPDSLSSQEKNEAVQILIEKYPEIAAKTIPENIVTLEGGTLYCKGKKIDFTQGSLTDDPKKLFITLKDAEKEKKMETVMFYNQELYKDDYEALQEIAMQYFDKTAEEYFKNIKEINQDIYVGIKDKRADILKIQLQHLKEIPKQINKLSQLTKLYLGNNQISKIENLEQQTQLQKLDLRYNQISKIENLEQQKQLEDLDLHNNQICKIENLQNQTELDTINLGGNLISKIENLEQQKKLKVLKLGGNQISKIENLEQQEQLIYLRLGNNQISKIESLEQQKKLRRLELEGNLINKIENLQNQTQLKYLEFDSNQIGRIENLEKQTQLTHLSLSHNKISKIENLDKLTKLQYLGLGKNQISKMDFKLAELRKRGVRVYGVIDD